MSSFWIFILYIWFYDFHFKFVVQLFYSCVHLCRANSSLIFQNQKAQSIRKFGLPLSCYKICSVKKKEIHKTLNKLFKIFIYKKIKFKFILFKINFYVFKSFWCADVKNNFLKIKKKYYFDIFPSKKHFES
jgi:hypothetical protein